MFGSLMITFTLDIIFDNSYYLIFISHVNLTAPVEFSFKNSYVAILCSPCLPHSRVSTPAHIG